MGNIKDIVVTNRIGLTVRDHMSKRIKRQNIANSLIITRA
jgi:hypothetical protein